MSQNYVVIFYKNDMLFSIHFLYFDRPIDTILIGEGTWKNLWSIKIILRSFEIVSELKVNFFKRNLYGLNLEDSFLEAA